MQTLIKFWGDEKSRYEREDRRIAEQMNTFAISVSCDRQGEQMSFFKSPKK
jgi:hypothetical protein